MIQKKIQKPGSGFGHLLGIRFWNLESSMEGWISSGLMLAG